MQSILDNEPAFNFNSAFQFGSAFKYSRIPDAGQGADSDSRDRVLGWHQKLIRSLILLSTYSAIALTFPLSFWFCVQVCTALPRDHSNQLFCPRRNDRRSKH